MIVFLIILGAVIALTSLIVFLVDYHENTDHNAPKIKFDSFKTFYDLNPERWELKYRCVACKEMDHSPIIGSYCKDKYYFYFGFFDWIRYLRWHSNLAKHNTSQANAQITAKMLAAVKQDIAKVEQLAQSEFNKANDIIQEVKERKENK